MIFGSICVNRSKTPLIPKSGEDELQIAPMEAAASMAMIASGILGMNPATRSPFCTPNSRSECANFSTSLNNS